jgi:hypothetical protein
MPGFSVSGLDLVFASHAYAVVRSVVIAGLAATVLSPRIP